MTNYNQAPAWKLGFTQNLYVPYDEIPAWGIPDSRITSDIKGYRFFTRQPILPEGVDVSYSRAGLRELTNPGLADIVLNHEMHGTYPPASKFAEKVEKLALTGISLNRHRIDVSGPDIHEYVPALAALFDELLPVGVRKSKVVPVKIDPRKHDTFGDVFGRFF